jgi:hypothetical protein
LIIDVDAQVAAYPSAGGVYIYHLGQDATELPIKILYHLIKDCSPMKTATLLISAALLSLTAGNAFAAGCEQGTPPSMPDGATASEAEMGTAMKAVKAYITATQEYQACLEAAGKGKMDVEAYNKSTELMEKLAADFNKQLKTFKSRNG